MLVLIYLACKVVPAKFQQWTRPMGIIFWITALITAAYVVLGINYLLLKLLGVRILF